MLWYFALYKHHGLCSAHICLLFMLFPVCSIYALNDQCRVHEIDSIKYRHQIGLVPHIRIMEYMNI